MCSTGETGAWHQLLPATPVSADCCGFGCHLLCVSLVSLLGLNFVFLETVLCSMRAGC